MQGEYADPQLNAPLNAEVFEAAPEVGDEVPMIAQEVLLFEGTDDAVFNKHDEMMYNLKGLQQELEQQTQTKSDLEREGLKVDDAKDITDDGMFRDRAAAENLATGQRRSGALHFCDLAGSERLAKSGSGDRPDLLREVSAPVASFDPFVRFLGLRGLPDG